jgi:hypothetical protein
MPSLDVVLRQFKAYVRLFGHNSVDGIEIHARALKVLGQRQHFCAICQCEHMVGLEL